jgi:hypothetical protein
MTIDLNRLSERHPALHATLAANLGFLGAVALQRRHRPGVQLEAEVQQDRVTHTLVWTPLEREAMDQVDRHRATEDGAEAVALGLSHAARGWTVRRRLQRRQHGDWLMEEAASGRKIVLEVGGLDDGSVAAKLNAELAQVMRSPLPYDRAACIVRFADVSAILVEVGHDAR